MYCEKCGKWSGKYPLCKGCYYENDEEYEDDLEFLDNENENLTCPICGEPTFIYFGNPRKDGLCRKHGTMERNGEIIQCENCGKWNTAGKACPCKSPAPKTIVKELPEEVDMDTNKVIVVNENNKSRCITCGKKTDGLLFCSDCYRKYNKKELLFKITGCTAVELLDEDYEGRYTCKDGHIVKSKSERDIDNYLFENDIRHAYEKPLPYGKSEKEVLHPDFFLPHYLGKGKHVYIEHWGYNENNLQYAKTKKFKLPIYQSLGITLICTFEKTDAGNIDAILERKLNKEYIEEGKINFEE